MIVVVCQFHKDSVKFADPTFTFTFFLSSLLRLGGTLCGYSTFFLYVYVVFVDYPL